MKCKVDKGEYKRLLERVEHLEKEVRYNCGYMFENWRLTKKSLFKMMESYFKTQCITTIVKRDKDMIIGEVRENAINNLFKEDKE